MRTFLTVLLGVSVLGCATTPKSVDVSGPLSVDREGASWARRTLGELSLEEKVGQVFMIWVRSQFLNAEHPEYLQLRRDLQRYHVGGLAMTVPVRGPLLVKSRPEEAALLLNRLQQDSKWPLLVAADFESGVSARIDGATDFPQAMAFGAAGSIEHARAFGEITAREARAIGVHWNFAPVADVNSNPANPIINTRSFGEDPVLVGALVGAYVEGARAGGMLTTAKHFPGHGDTDTDSHYGVARVGGDLARLESVELPPFRRAIEAGVNAVMVAHVTVPALSDRVATTSTAIVTDLLKTQMGFDGVVVTDALDMAALTRQYASDVGRAAVEAFKAGNDVLLIPADLDASWKAMVEAVTSGEVSEDRLDEAVLKLLRWKAALGLHRSRLVDVARVPARVGRPQDAAAAQQAAADAVVLVRDDGGVLPLEAAPPQEEGLPYLSTVQASGRLLVVILSRDVGGLWGRELHAQVRGRVPGARVVYVDRVNADGVADAVLAAADEADAVVVAAFVAPEPGERTADAGPGDPSGRLLQALLDRAASRTAVVAVGSPYVAQAFPAIQTYLCTFSNTPVSERSAVRALFGEIPLRGRLPVTIPGVADRAEGNVHGPDQRRSNAS